MYKKTISTFLLAMALCISAMAQHTIYADSPATDKNKQHHIVIQLTSSDSLVWNGILNNVKHLNEEWPGNVQIEVVTHGPGIEMMMITKTNVQNRIVQLKKAGVLFAVCENSMKGKNLMKDAMIPEAAFVHSGVVEIVLKQEQGWSYLKAGF